MTQKHRVVILGGGFAGLNAAQKLRRAPVELTLIDRRNFHLFQPLLYQVATGSLSPGEISAPLRGVLSKQKNALVLLGEAADIDPDKKQRSSATKFSTRSNGPSALPPKPKLASGSPLSSWEQVPRVWNWLAPSRKSPMKRLRTIFAASIQRKLASF